MRHWFYARWARNFRLVYGIGAPPSITRNLEVTRGQHVESRNLYWPSGPELLPQISSYPNPLWCWNGNDPLRWPKILLSCGIKPAANPIIGVQDSMLWTTWPWDGEMTLLQKVSLTVHCVPCKLRYWSNAADVWLATRYSPPRKFIHCPHS